MAQFKVNENILVDVEHWRTDAIDNWFDTAATDEMVHIDTDDSSRQPVDKS